VFGINRLIKRVKSNSSLTWITDKIIQLKLSIVILAIRTKLPIYVY
jgi:hypothetical protein